MELIPAIGISSLRRVFLARLRLRVRGGGGFFMTAGNRSSLRRGSLAALVLAALLGGCATAGPSSVAEGAATPDGLMHMADKARERGELPVAASLYRKAHDEEPQRVKPLVS